MFCCKCCGRRWTLIIMATTISWHLHEWYWKRDNLIQFCKHIKCHVYPQFSHQLYHWTLQLWKWHYECQRSGSCWHSLKVLLLFKTALGKGRSWTNWNFQFSKWATWDLPWIRWQWREWNWITYLQKKKWALSFTKKAGNDTSIFFTCKFHSGFSCLEITNRSLLYELKWFNLKWRLYKEQKVNKNIKNDQVKTGTVPGFNILQILPRVTYPQNLARVAKIQFTGDQPLQAGGLQRVLQCYFFIFFTINNIDRMCFCNRKRRSLPCKQRDGWVSSIQSDQTD